MRVDKLLSNSGYGSRKDVKQMMKKHVVTVNGKRIRSGNIHIDPERDEIKTDGKIVTYRPYIYIMLHKPKGYLSATEDLHSKTVIDLLPEELKRYDPFPVGRLDKYTEGLLLLTNDGMLNHVLTSPKKGIPKVYVAFLDGFVDQKHEEDFETGLVLDDGYRTRPASLAIHSADQTGSEVSVTIQEGKYHQVKRMFQAIGLEVLYLKRKEMGEIQLDNTLLPGAFRHLTEEEEAYCMRLKDGNFSTEQ